MVASLTLLSGCIFSPEKKDPPKAKPPLQYLKPISPSNVLQNLVASYMNRDSIQTAAVYDLNYQGTSTDPSLPTQIPAFSKTDEVRHVGRLKLDPNIVSVFLDLGSPGTWQVLEGYASDPVGWKVIPITSQTVKIEDISRATTWQSVNQVIEYTFKPTPVSGAPEAEDTTWTVVRWTEIAN
ncbi:MAG TPA: hypothetical protein VLV48_09130 [Thermoanaerobaculia bacterium]|nr:hypothetical protein [Thermoanaerobaculia bacterium]